MTDTKKTLKIIFSICLLLHVIFLLILQLIFRPLYYQARGHTLYDDGECYSIHARVISYLLLNKLPDKNIKIKHPDLFPALGYVLNFAQEGKVISHETYQVGYITYFYSLIYATFGYHQILINIMNILLNLLTGIIIFRICKIVFDEKVGIIATTMFLFNPILFHYATTKVAESVYIFVAYAFIYYVTIFPEKKIRYTLPIIFITFFLMYLFKETYSISLVAVSLIYLIINHFLKHKKLLPFYLLTTFIILLLFSNKISHKIIGILQNAAYHNMSYQEAGGLTYNLLIFGKDYYNYGPVQWFVYFLNGWYHMLFEPLYPNSVLYLLYYPFKIIFLFLCIFAFWGLLISLRMKKKPAILLLLFFILIGSIIALGSGNAGTMLRHRDIITPIVFIFSSVFLARYFRFTTHNIKGQTAQKLT